MKKKFEVDYTLTFHIEAENEKEAAEIGQESLMDYLKNTSERSSFSKRTLHGFIEKITEL